MVLAAGLPVKIFSVAGTVAFFALAVFLLYRLCGFLYLLCGALVILAILYCDEISLALNQYAATAPAVSCPGCGTYYPAVRATVYRALPMCADILGITVPDTERLIESPPPRANTDGIPRAYFRLPKQKNIHESLTLSTAKECLAQSIEQSFFANRQFYFGSEIHGLYIDDFSEDSFSYILAVIPACSGCKHSTDSYISGRTLSERYPWEALREEGETVDNEL